MPLMSKYEYSQHRRATGLPGGSPPAVTYAIRDGRITIDPHTKLIDSEVADRQWAENTSPAAQMSGVKAGAVRAAYFRDKAAGVEKEPVVARLVATSKPVLPAESKEDFAKSRASKEFYEAGLAQLKYEEKKGLLIPASVVKKVLFEAGLIVRSGHDDLVAQLAPELASAVEIQEVERLLKQALNAVDNLLADRVANLDEALLAPSDDSELDQAAA